MRWAGDKSPGAVAAFSGAFAKLGDWALMKEAVEAASNGDHRRAAMTMRQWQFEYSRASEPAAAVKLFEVSQCSDSNSYWLVHTTHRRPVPRSDLWL